MQETILRFFQHISTPFLDHFFTAVTRLGEQYFIIVVISWVYWNYSKKQGFFLSYIFLFSNLVNGLAKDIAQTKRPFQSLEGIEGKRVKTAEGFSFPSGHTQGASTLFLTLALMLRKKIFMVLAIFLSALVATSRIYLGVHWPVDVLGGFVFALLVSFIFYPLLNRLYGNQEKFFSFILYSLLFFYLVLGLIMIWNTFYAEQTLEIDNYVRMTGIASGSFIFYMLQEKKYSFSNDATFWVKLLRFIPGFAGILGIFVGLKLILPDNELFTYVRYFLLGAWITFIFPLIGLRLGLFKKSGVEP